MDNPAPQTAIQPLPPPAPRPLERNALMRLGIAGAVLMGLGTAGFSGKMAYDLYIAPLTSVVAYTPATDEAGRTHRRDLATDIIYGASLALGFAGYRMLGRVEEALQAAPVASAQADLDWELDENYAARYDDDG